MRAVFMGAGGIGLPSLRALIEREGVSLAGVVTQPDRPAGRGNKLTPPEVKRVAAEAGIPVLQPQRLRSPGEAEKVAALDPDVIVVMAYGQILPKAVLDLPRLACLNLHASLLPRHRGASPIQAAIREGDAETGITVMHMAEGLDAGDVLLALPTAIGRRETAGELHDRLAVLAAEAMVRALDLLEKGEVPRIPQEDSQATYAGKLSRESGVIDWTRPAGEVERLVRAMNPWPAASTRVPVEGGSPARLKVFASESADCARGRPGEILEAGSGGILVASGRGGLRLREVQADGGRRMDAGEWCRGRAVSVGGFCC